ncbi:MAG: D-alanine--D-alanine ligase [Actinobacteria bacterium]|nr:D-alanine--D-alanine ligase [Actinomycetota bacterium]
MRILILYNVAATIKKGDELDMVCEQEIQIIVPLVATLLRAKGYKVETLETNHSLWENLKAKKLSFDLVLNLAEAFGGTNSNEVLVPTMLEALEIPFTGATAHNMTITLDKAQTKLIALANGVPTPAYQVFRDGTESPNQNLAFPLIVKPVREEASIGIRHDSVVTDLESLRCKMKEVIRLYRQPAIVESFVVGREISVGIIGNNQNLHVLPPLEFLFVKAKTPYEQFRSYEYKWGGKKEQMVEAVLSSETTALLADYVRRMFMVTECRDYARMDFRIGSDGKIYLLEVNYNPGIGPNTHGLNNTLTKMASFEGCSFEDFVERIVLTAAQRERLV